MTYQVLARKWRPKTFDDVVGESHIVRSLQNSIKNNKVGHAYLFTGTRGIGKTSIARIFAKALRCQNLTKDANPCLQCQSCLEIDNSSAIDFMEIDGASNNGVDNIRQLIDNVQYLPTYGKYKVYVIDEVHMLSTSAFNALLKTLEEPPPHVVFIFATTEVQKLMGTVLSRCQRFDFRSATVPDLVNHIKKIASVENIKFDNDELVRQLAIQGKGSIRDTLSLLDQILNYSENNHITEDVLISSLGIARLSAIKELTMAIFSSKTDKVSEVYNQLLNENISPANIAQSLLDSLFEIIQNMDNPKLLMDRGLIESNALDDIEAAELFWIFEVLAKDLSFSLQSIDPEKITQVVLQKIALRRTFVGKGEKKN